MGGAHHPEPEQGVLEPYVGLPFNPAHYLCPSDIDGRMYDGTYPYSYAANALMFFDPLQSKRGFCPPLARIVNPSEKILMVDGRADSYIARPAFTSYSALSSRHLGRGELSVHEGNATWFLSYGGNVLYVDGHAAFYSDGLTKREDNHADYTRRVDPYTP